MTFVSAADRRITGQAQLWNGIAYMPLKMVFKDWAIAQALPSVNLLGNAYQLMRDLLQIYSASIYCKVFSIF